MYRSVVDVCGNLIITTIYCISSAASWSNKTLSLSQFLIHFINLQRLSKSLVEPVLEFMRGSISCGTFYPNGFKIIIMYLCLGCNHISFQNQQSIVGKHDSKKSSFAREFPLNHSVMFCRVISLVPPLAKKYCQPIIIILGLTKCDQTYFNSMWCRTQLGTRTSNLNSYEYFCQQKKIDQIDIDIFAPLLISRWGDP